MERQGGTPGSGWHRSANATLKSQKPQHPPCVDDATLRLDESPKSPLFVNEKTAVSPPCANLKAEASVSFPPAPGSPQRKKIKRPSNVYHFKPGKQAAENKGADTVQKTAELPCDETGYPTDGSNNYSDRSQSDAANLKAEEAQKDELFRAMAESEAAVIEAEKNTGYLPCQPDYTPEWQEHPITKALNAYMDPENPLNPVKVITDSLLPVHARRSIPVEREELPITPVPPEVEPNAAEAAAAIDVRDAFWDFWLGHQEQMRKQCLRLMAGNVADAEDALSNAMLRASQKFPNYADSIINGKAWLRKLVYNVCMDHYRQDRMTEYKAFDQESDIPPSGAMFTEKPQSPEDKALSREQMHQLDECIEGLSSNLRVPLYLRCIEGWSYPDIAAELDLKTDTVRKRIQLARDHLRRSNIR